MRLGYPWDAKKGRVVPPGAAGHPWGWAAPGAGLLLGAGLPLGCLWGAIEGRRFTAIPQEGCVMCGEGVCWCMCGPCVRQCVRHACAMRAPCAGHVWAMCWPCAGHVWAMCWPCVGHVLAMCGPCVLPCAGHAFCHVWAMRVPCVGHARAMCDTCAGHARAMRGPCAGHVLAMCGPCVCHAWAMCGPCAGLPWPLPLS